MRQSLHAGAPSTTRGERCMAQKTTYDIIAATGCPTGIAHTFMAKEALEKAAAERGLTIKVETHGQVGIEDELTASQIAAARAVVVAADKDVQAERFAGKPMVSVGVSKALSVEEAGKLIDRALAAKGDAAAAAAIAASADDEDDEKESIGHQIYKHLMNGVSHMLVFVVAGGVLTAISFLWGITSYDSTASDYNTFAACLKIIGDVTMNLMVPVLAAFIAESIGKRPALVPGFVAGMIAINGLPTVDGLIDAGGSGVGFGFLGGIVGGFLAGYTIVLLEKAFSGIPQSLNGLKAIFLYPLCSTFIVGLIMLAISGPMSAINQAMMDFLQSLYSAGPIPLGLAIGCMCAFDMGGPVNKAAYTTGTLLLTEAIAAGVGTETYNFGTNFMAAVSAACIVPPLITTFAVVVGKKYFSREDHDAGIVNLILGCTHITEGAIPFMTKNIWPVMPIMMLGSSIASILTIFFGVHDPAPHGGFLVLPIVDGAVQWVIAILIGVLVGGVLFVAFKRYEYSKNQAAQPQLATEGAAAAAPTARAVAAKTESTNADVMKPDHVLLDCNLATRDEALRELAAVAAKLGIASDSEALTQAFLAREAEGTTGMTDGFAIPHAKSAAVRTPAVMVLKNATGIDAWETLDDQPVTCAIALLVPEQEAGTAHLEILSKVAKALMDEEFRAQLKAADEAEAIARLVSARLEA